jgi:hypothetical protein
MVERRVGLLVALMVAWMVEMWGDSREKRRVKLSVVVLVWMLVD